MSEWREGLYLCWGCQHTAYAAVQCSFGLASEWVSRETKETCTCHNGFVSHSTGCHLIAAQTPVTEIYVKAIGSYNMCLFFYHNKAKINFYY